MLLGYVEKFDFERRTIFGWAADKSSEDKASISLSFDGKLIYNYATTIKREDLNHITSNSAGFILPMPEFITSFDVLSGKVELWVVTDNDSQILPLTVRAKMLALKQLESELTLIDGLNYKPNSAATCMKNSESWVDRVSELLVPVGAESPDGTAMVGKNGHLFLTGGSNNLRAQYSQSTLVASRTSGLWAALMRKRRRHFEGTDTRFIQLVIPEKLTALRNLAPFKITGPTPLLAALEREMATEEYYISGLTTLSSLNDVPSTFRPNDTHLSARGAQEIFATIVDRISGFSGTVVREIPIETAIVGLGDLSKRFYENPIFCLNFVPEPSNSLVISESMALVHQYDPEKGFVGRQRVWQNPDAPLQLCVVAFGNSFFGSGVNPGSLSWWAARFFKEFHLIWKSEIDYDYLSGVNDVDVVIGQTVERFLPIVPKD